MAGWTIGMKAWAGLLAAVPPLCMGWAWADCEICAWTALGASVAAVGVGVWIARAERF
jgi:hypothetical protein